MLIEPVIHGSCDAGFESVKDAFAKNFRDGLEVGAATSVVLDGKVVVDLWAGHLDAECGRTWERDTLVHVMSTTKGVTSLVAHRLVEQGLLDVDAPVAKYWPEFAAAGKETLPVRYLLTHEAGLPALDELQPAGTMENWEAMTALLAQQKPAWEPGSTFGYHPITFGFLVGEVIRRVSGKSVGRLIREEIAGPLGVDFELGFGEELDSRVATLLAAPPASDDVMDLVKLITADLFGPISRAFLIAMPAPGVDFNSRVSRAAEVPAANGHTNARSVAKIYGALAQGGVLGGVRLLEPESIARATEKQVGGIDSVLAADAHFGLGFGLRRPDDALIGPRSFGHPGFGGSQGFADPDRRLGFGYVMNQLGHSTADQFILGRAPGTPAPDTRATNILRALYAVL